MTRFIKTRQDKKKSSQKENSSQKSTKKETKRKCRYYKCTSPVVGSISCDIDLPKFNYCKKHKADVNSSILWAILGVMELSNDALGIPKKRYKKK